MPSDPSGNGGESSLNCDPGSIVCHADANGKLICTTNELCKLTGCDHCQSLESIEYCKHPELMTHGRDACDVLTILTPKVANTGSDPFDVIDIVAPVLVVGGIIRAVGSFTRRRRRQILQ
jgi:hypothetical protein